MIVCQITSVLIKSGSYYYLIMELQVLSQASYHLKIIILTESIIEKLVPLLFAPLDPDKKE